MLNKIVATLEEAKRLRDAGWKKETVFCYRNNGHLYKLNTVKSAKAMFNEDIIFTPTLQELVEEFMESKVANNLALYPAKDEFMAWIYFSPDGKKVNAENFSNKNPISACVEMYCWLKEENYV